MTEATLALYSGILLSWFFSYVPGLNKKFDALQTGYKRLIMLGSLAIVSLGVFGISCLGWLDLGVTCDQAGGIALLQTFILATIANQSAYAISPQPNHS